MSYLDDATMKELRDELARLRKPGSYEPGRWSVSALNRDPKALGTKPPLTVKVRDITLRTIEQPVGIGVSMEERYLIGEAIARANIPSMQIGAFWNGLAMGEDFLTELVRRIKKVKPDIELCLLITRKEEIQTAAKMGIDKVKFAQTCVVGMIRGFMYGAVWKGQDWKGIRLPKSPEEQVERWLRLVKAAKEAGVKISIGNNQASYATEEYLKKVVPPLSAAGADEFSFSDSFHGLGPDAWRFLCHTVKELAPKMDVCAHIHNDWGMGTASVVSSTLGGCMFPEVSVNGLGGPAVGQAELAESVAALEAMYGISTGIDMTQLTPLSRLVGDLTRRPMPAWKPITGEDAWVYDADEAIEVSEIDPLFPVPANPEIFGNKLKMKGHVSCTSGPYAMYYRLKAAGVEADPPMTEAVYKKYKEQVRLRKRDLTDDELVALAHQ